MAYTVLSHVGSFSRGSAKGSNGGTGSPVIENPNLLVPSYMRLPAPTVFVYLTMKIIIAQIVFM